MVGKPCILTKKDVQFRKTTRLFQETSYKAGFCVPLISAFQQPSRHQTTAGCDHAEHDHILPQRSRHRTKPHRSQQRYQNCQQSDCRHHLADPLSVQEEQQTDADQQRHQHQTSCQRSVHAEAAPQAAPREGHHKGV